MTRLAGQVAVVTGAASGIGRALAIGLARRGADLALADVDALGLAETAALCEGVRVSNHQVDVSDRAAMERFVDEVIGEHARVNVLFNNAGVTVIGYFDDLSLEDIEWNLRVNLNGVLYGCKLFLPHLLASEQAHIVNISSIFGIVGPPMQASYCASKYAVRGLTEVLWEEFSGSHLRITVVHPGGVSTNIVSSGRTYEAALSGRLTRFFERLLSPERAAEKILRGVERNRRRILVGPDARVMDWLRRLAPTRGNALIPRLLADRGLRRRRAEKLAHWARLRKG